MPTLHMQLNFAMPKSPVGPSNSTLFSALPCCLRVSYTSGAFSVLAAIRVPSILFALYAP